MKVIEEHKIDFELIFDIFEDAFSLDLQITNIRAKKKHVTGLSGKPLDTVWFF